MAQIIYTRRARQNILAFHDFYANHDPELADRAVMAILSSIEKLALRPQVGRPAYGSLRLRERVIPFGAQGFVALYEIDSQNDNIRIAAIRHQKQSSYKKIAD
jgi:plasmid stabilization system protein ParE